MTGRTAAKALGLVGLIDVVAMVGAGLFGWGVLKAYETDRVKELAQATGQQAQVTTYDQNYMDACAQFFAYDYNQSHPADPLKLTVGQVLMVAYQAAGDNPRAIKIVRFQVHATGAGEPPRDAIAEAQFIGWVPGELTENDSPTGCS